MKYRLGCIWTWIAGNCYASIFEDGKAVAHYRIDPSIGAIDAVNYVRNANLKGSL